MKIDEDMNIENLPPMQEQKESIKLIKNSKGYNWEIRILSLEVEAIEKLNTQMMERFGGI